MPTNHMKAGRETDWPHAELSRRSTRLVISRVEGLDSTSSNLGFYTKGINCRLGKLNAVFRSSRKILRMANGISAGSDVVRAT